MKLPGLKLVLLAIVGILLQTYPARGADWPQWRGPNRDGISKETGLLKEWPADGPKLLWQIKDMGGGFSTPAVVGDRLYLLTSKGADDEFVEARNVSDGKQVWSTRIGKVGNPDQNPSYPGSRSTPTVDGQFIYALGSDGDLVCLALADGKPKWQKNVRTDFGGKPGIWAYSESPLIDGDTLVCTPGGNDATIVALNKTSGDVIWKSPIPGNDAAYGSIIIVDAAGTRQYVTALPKGLVGVDAKTGKLLWQYDKSTKGSPAVIPTPVAHESRIYSSAARAGGALVELAADGGAIKAKQIYFDPKLPTAIGGSILVGENLYGTSQVLTCSDFNTGKVKWTDRSIAPASLLYAEGNLYLHSENGELALVEASPEACKEKGRFTPPGQPQRGSNKAWAYPVISDGKLFIRDLGVMWCYEIKSR